MILGRSVISWIILAFVAVCVFILAKWLIPLLFGAIGVAIPKLHARSPVPQGPRHVRDCGGISLVQMPSHAMA